MAVETSIDMACAAAAAVAFVVVAVDADNDMVSHIDRVEYRLLLKDAAADSCA